MAYKIPKTTKEKPIYIKEPYGLPQDLTPTGTFKEERKSLSGFTGTQEYHKGYLGIQLTDGSYFVRTNNASWLIADICSVLKVEPKVKNQEFVSVKFKVNNDNTAEAVYSDGNDKVLYIQKYKYTDFKEHFKEDKADFFYTNNVLMLNSEY